MLWAAKIRCTLRSPGRRWLIDVAGAAEVPYLMRGSGVPGLEALLVLSNLSASGQISLDL